MRYKPNQRVAYYEVTKKSEGCTVKVEVGEILVDRPRGEWTTWEFSNAEGDRFTIVGKRLGFARVPADPDGNHIHEPKLQAALEELKARLHRKSNDIVSLNGAAA